MLARSWITLGCCLFFTACQSSAQTDAATTTDAAKQDATPPADKDSGTQPDDTGTMGEMDAGGSGGQCIDLTVYADADQDGYGSASMSMSACLKAGEVVQGYVRQSGDCAPTDDTRNPLATEICGDFVDDDCDPSGQDLDCPTTQTAGIDVPSWNCTGAPPANVYAFAKFPSGGGFYKDGACFMFFEGLKDEFYVQHTLQPASTSPNCNSFYGCVCPSLQNQPAYDKRLFAFTLEGAPEGCEQLQLDDFDNRERGQPVSNRCRKYLFQMHQPAHSYAYVGRQDQLDARLTRFSNVEVACLYDAPHAYLPYKTLLNVGVERNPGFVKKP